MSYKQNLIFLFNPVQIFPLPFLVYTVCPLVEGQRFDLVLADLARLWLQSGGNVSLQGPILSLDGPHLQQLVGMKHMQLIIK